MKPLPIPLPCAMSHVQLASRKDIHLLTIDENRPVAQARRETILALEEYPDTPVVVEVCLDGDGKTRDEWTPLAVLCLFSAIGASALVLTAADSETLPEIVAALRRHTATFPLGVTLPEDAGEPLYTQLFGLDLLVTEGDPAQAEPLARQHGCFGGAAAALEALSSPPEEADEDTILAVAGGQVHYLDPEVDIDSETDLDEEEDIARWLLDQEEENWGAIRLVVDSQDAVDRLCEAQYMIKVPLAIRSASPELYEQAVRLFCGTVIYDGTCEIEDDQLMRLVRKYGLIRL